MTLSIQTAKTSLHGFSSILGIPEKQPLLLHEKASHIQLKLEQTKAASLAMDQKATDESDALARELDVNQKISKDINLKIEEIRTSNP